MLKSASNLRLAITPGEPAAIGIDLTLICAQNSQAQYVVIADPDVLEARAKQLRIDDVTVRLFQPDQPPLSNTLDVIPIPCEAKVMAGVLNKKNSPYVLKTLETAVRLCQNNICQALVTGPVHKGIINEAGITFTGHTEFLANLTNSYPVMLLAADTLRVALVTTHLPLKQVSEAINSERLTKVIRILQQDLQKRFGLKNPRIGVCGLNPHAGEGGHLGDEEIRIISPTLDKLRAEGLNLIGPLPADTAFVPRQLDTLDAVLAMYHDQGLPVLKYHGFGHAVNITLGLPIIRTSVDHGTALDLAGTGKIDTGSMQAAITQAISMASPP